MTHTVKPKSVDRSKRKQRADGKESRRKILDTTAQLAGERGFDGTSIAAVSERSGLPKSSIYWHFEDKDDLIASVIEDSYQRWIEHIKSATGPEDHQKFGQGFRRSVAAITAAPDFLRLGLMLTLDQRREPTPARDRFIAIRAEVRDNLYRLYRATFDEVSDEGIVELTRLTMALTDGYFLADQAGEVKMADDQEMIATAITAAAERLASKSR